ncbi:hypothetical protein [Agrobacterium salinitolerans]|uniref:hypothetical protein n=1 Tax=Agrobacterium salinitolerans TaxID=1183413 RepID=UPI0022B84EAD|nr:hypothetical protein [Agrobacterium salinitolerans]MCZ7888925.1 hypothetical protein [Agrobacterium salinitolerans]
MSPVFTPGKVALLASLILTAAASQAHAIPVQPQLASHSHIVLVDDDSDDDDDNRFSRRYRGDNESWPRFRGGSRDDDDDDDDDD